MRIGKKREKERERESDMRAEAKLTQGSMDEGAATVTQK